MYVLHTVDETFKMNAEEVCVPYCTSDRLIATVTQLQTNVDINDKTKKYIEF